MLRAFCNVSKVLGEARASRDAGKWKEVVEKNILPRCNYNEPIGSLLIDTPIVHNRDTMELFEENPKIAPVGGKLGSRSLAEEEAICKAFNGRRTLMNIAPAGANVISQRYSHHRDDETIELPEEMFERVGRALAKSYVNPDTFLENNPKHEMDEGYWAAQFTHMMVNKLATPAGRTLANAGLQDIVANCIVRHIGDSLHSILYTMAEAGLLQQDGSGMGFPLHLMRPAGSVVRNHQTRASGPVGFLRMYHNTFSEIKQRGRHGANMAVMRVDHPDIVEFINCKREEGSIHTFNISVGITRRFMEEVVQDVKTPWMCEFNGTFCEARIIKRDHKNHYASHKSTNLTARQIFNKIVAAAHRNGEPGVVFLDEANDRNPVPGLGRIEACNPCGSFYLFTYLFFF